MLLVDDEQPQIAHGSEDRGSRAEDDRRGAAANPLPLLLTLRSAEVGVKHRHLASEPRGELAGKRGHQGDLGNEQNRGASLPTTELERTEVDLRLPRAGDSGQKEGREAPAFERPVECESSLFLVVSKIEAPGAA